MLRTLKRSPIAGEELGDALATLRERAPLVQCLTNIVVANFTANVLLALGASPAMVDNPREAEAFAQRADGVLVNLGTPRASTVEAMALAVRGAEAAGIPWVLDPVAAGVLPWRTSVATELLTAHRPTIVRGNASEILALSGGSGGKGVDSLATADEALEAAVVIAAARGTVVAVSGAIDHLTDGATLVRIQNGHPYLTRITGSGCALGALMAAFAAVVDEPLRAAAAATAAFTIAADEAGDRAAGPGSFAVALLDSLHRLTPETVAAAIRLA